MWYAPRLLQIFDKILQNMTVMADWPRLAASLTTPPVHLQKVQSHFLWSRLAAESRRRASAAAWHMYAHDVELLRADTIASRAKGQRLMEMSNRVSGARVSTVRPVFDSLAVDESRALK